MKNESEVPFWKFWDYNSSFIGGLIFGIIAGLLLMFSLPVIYYLFNKWMAVWI